MLEKRVIVPIPTGNHPYSTPNTKTAKELEDFWNNEIKKNPHLYPANIVFVGGPNMTNIRHTK